MKRIKVTGIQDSNEKIFWEILLGEKYLDEVLIVPREVLRQAGGVNSGLKEKQNYELMLRIAKNYGIEVWEMCDDFVSEEEIRLDFPKTEDAVEALKTDCYVIGRYREELLNGGYFDAAVESVIEAAKEIGAMDTIVPWLEEMLTRTESYRAIDGETRPFLIYKGSNICHNVLNTFAGQFGKALEEAGYPVEYYDLEQGNIGDIVQLAGKSFHAVIGFQTYAFSIAMKDGKTCLHDLVGGRKYNFIFDHPIWLCRHLQQNIKDYTVLTHDWDYVNYVEKYFGQKARMLPPAGIESEREKDEDGEREYDLSFVGTYGDFLYEAGLIHGMERKWRFLANHFLLKMRKNPNLPAEQALREVLRERNRAVSDQEFVEIHYELRRVVYCVMHYYRYRIIRTILEAGIQIDVFGDSWSHCPLRKYPNLIIHPNAEGEESMRVYRHSKLSLNIMSWHKAGFTERIANCMLSGAVVVTDKSGYLVRNFKDEREMLLFDLEEIQALPERIQNLLEEDSRRNEMAMRAYHEAIEKHTWKACVEDFLKILKEG